MGGRVGKRSICGPRGGLGTGPQGNIKSLDVFGISPMHRFGIQAVSFRRVPVATFRIGTLIVQPTIYLAVHIVWLLEPEMAMDTFEDLFWVLNQLQEKHH